MKLVAHLRLAALALLLTGCASQELEFTPSTVLLPEAEPPRTTRPARLVRIPASAPWLGETVVAQYRGLSARTALKQLVPNGMLAFRLPEGEDPQGPPVDYALPGNATRQAHIAAVCAAADWAWRLEEGLVVIAATETRTFQLEASPGQRVERVSTAELDDTASGAAGVERVVADSAHEQVLAALRGAAEGTEASVDLVGSSGQLVITARPSVMRRLAGIVERVNLVATRRVALEFVLYEVDVSDSETRSLNVAALREAAIGLALNVTPPGSSALRDLSGDLSILWTDEADDRAFGSELVFRWLTQQGETRVRIQKNVVAVHNQVTELQDVQITRYISEVTIQQQAAGATSVVSPSVRTESVKTGETWAVLPTIVDDRVSLRLASSRSELVALEEYSFSDDAVAGTLPVTAVSSVSAPISLADGETRVITNLSSSRQQSQQTVSPLLAWLPWLGEAKSKGASSVETVMTITADIL